jgi:hypothetical protein
MAKIIERARYAIARFIAPRSMLFNADMSRELDRKIVEVESLREQLGRLTK